MRFFLFLFLLIIPINALASKAVDVNQLQLSGVARTMASEKIALGLETRRGIEARAYLEPQLLLDLSTPLANGLKHYLLSIKFTKSRSGKVVNIGQAAARTFVTGNRGVQTVRLETEADRWTAVLVLNTEKETLIKVGSKLEDGKKRIFSFFFNTPLSAGQVPPGASVPSN